MKVELDEENPGWLLLRGEVRESAAVKTVPGVRWDSRRNAWRCRCSWASCLQLRGVFGPYLEVGPRLAQWSREERATRIVPQMDLRARGVAGIDEGDPRLFPFQRAGVRFLLGGRGVILADQMGTGKTVQTLVALAEGAPETLPALVIAPRASSAHQWVAEAQRWTPGLDAVAVLGTVAKRRKILAERHDIYVTTRGLVQQHSSLAAYGNLALRRCPAHGGPSPLAETKCEAHPKELNRPWGAVVVDEAHRIKDPRAKTTRAVWSVCASASFRWLLTGTPIANTTADLWSLLHAADAFEWPSRSAFLDRYCETSYNPWGGLEVQGIRRATRDELFAVIDPRMLRRTKAEVLPQLPPKLPTKVVVVEQPTQQRRRYEEARDQLLADLDAGTLVVTSPLTLTIRLRQLAAASLEERPPAEPDGVPGYGLVEPSAKLDAFMEIIDDLGDAPAVVFAEFPELLNMASRRLQNASPPVGHSLVHGGVPDLTRERELQRWSEGGSQLLLMTLGTGSEGLNLTRASHTIYLQRPWSSIVNAQSEDRTHRFGQEAPCVTYVDIVTDDTIEQRVLDVLVAKNETLQDLVRDKERLKELLR